MKKIVSILLVISLVLLGLVFTRNATVKTILQDGLNFATGLKISIGRLNAGLSKPEINARDIRVYNPAGFSEKVMADLPEFYLNYNLGSFFKAKPHIYSMRIYVKDFIVVKNAKGITNVDEIKTVKQMKEDARAGRKRKPPELRIGDLYLKIERVALKDYSQNPKQPTEKTFNVNIDEHYKNIDNMQRLVNLVVVKALANTNIGNITGLDLSAVQQDISDVLKQATGTIKGFFESIFGIK